MWKDDDLRALDFLAVLYALGLLLFLFRLIERWLHQHIFKVGWLITNDYQTTTVLYYLLFLPGIILHEFTLWLFAGLLNVRADRAIGFPEKQEIGELRLNFVRVSPQAGSLRFALIKFAPLLTGIVCLWAIAARIFRWQEVAVLSPAGSIDELARAIVEFTRTADFWLWFYLAFTIANTMFPSLNAQLSVRRKSALALTTLSSLLLMWHVGGALEISIALGIEVLVSSLLLVVLQVILINFFAVLGLGAMEALIERLSGRSATFEDGKMITMSRQEAQEQKQLRAQERRASHQRPASERAAVIRSVYDLKLPIPGPPGREPVSRRAVSVVNMPSGDTGVSRRPDINVEASGAPTKTTVSVEHGAPDRHEPGEVKPARRAATNVQKHSTAADEEARVASAIGRTPFSRPFTTKSAGRQKDDADLQDADDQPDAGRFLRPFTMRTRSEAQPNVLNVPPPLSQPEDSTIGATKGNDTQPRAYKRRTRPSPKPSSRTASEVSSSPETGDDELTYEPFDDDDVPAEIDEH